MSGAESNEKKNLTKWKNQQNEKATYDMKVNIYKPSIRH